MPDVVMSSCRALLQSYIVSGAICQWYWHTGGSRSRGSERCKVEGLVSTPVAYAFGPSFGTLCAAAALQAVLLRLRWLWSLTCAAPALLLPGQASHIMQQGPAAGSGQAQAAADADTLRSGCCAGLVRNACASSACVGVVGDALSGATQFAVVRAAMRGLGMREAAQDVVSLLKRNAMDAYNVW